jgi:DNA-binding PadR family transcriptional regulator
MSTKYALLGLLNIRKMSAYDLAKFAKESIGYF